jgi:hypothetical protein
MQYNVFPIEHYHINLLCKSSIAASSDSVCDCDVKQYNNL